MFLTRSFNALVTYYIVYCKDLEAAAVSAALSKFA